MNYARKLESPYFRGVYMRNKLPSTGPYYQESAIVNLDNDNGPGTHVSGEKLPHQLSSGGFFSNYSGLFVPLQPASISYSLI